VKAHEILNEAAKLAPLTLKTDNPGGKWLQHKREDTESEGRRPSGRYNVMGSTTGWYNREAFIPVDVLKDIPGTNQEQSNVRQSDLDWLTDFMGKHGKLPDADWHEFNEYAPMVVVGQDGKPFVNEGNHRIMAAAKLGFYALPVEIKYYNGGEQEKGMLNPNSVQKYDSLIQKMGITYGNYKV
tara:strand:+ start:723 stop:1271 length:549 start_codon:yes stop_codon:yes gene_type:complete